MKVVLRIPTNEQFAFIEVETDISGESIGSAPNAVREAYNAFTRAFKDQGGIPDKEFSQMLDEYLSTKTIVNGQEKYEKLSPNQRMIISEIRKSFNRLKR